MTKQHKLDDMLTVNFFLPVLEAGTPWSGFMDATFCVLTWNNKQMSFVEPLL